MALSPIACIQILRFLSPAQFGADGGTAKGIKAPVGTGPWVHAEARKGEYDLFKRNESYWGKKPELEEVLVKVVPEGDSRVVDTALKGASIAVHPGAANYYKEKGMKVPEL